MDNIGISIEGLGRPSEAVSGSQGTVWALTSNAPADTDPDGAGDYTWSQGLVDMPTPSGYSATPETGEMQAGAFSAALHASEEHVTKVLLARQNRPSTNLVGAISKTAPSITLPSAGLYSSGDVIYVGAETIRITADSGAGAYAVERGFWNSTATRHGDNAGVYDRPPFYKNRAVTLWTSDGAAMHRRARTYLRNIKGTKGGTQLTMQTEEAVSALSSVKRMRAQPDLSSITNVTTQDPDSDQFFLSGDRSAFESTVAKEEDLSGASQDAWYYGSTDNVSNKTEFAYVQLGGAVVPLTRALYQENDAPVVGFSAGFWDKNVIKIDFSDEGVADLDAVYELAVWNRALPKAPYKIADLETVVNNPWHPVVIAGVLLCSTAARRANPDRLDMVAGDVGLGVPWLFGDDGIQAFLDVGNSLETTKIDQLVLGWDGEPVDVFAVAIRLLLSAGYYLASNQQGYLIPKKFETLDVSSFVDAQTNNSIRVRWPRSGDPVWEWDPGFSEAISEKTGIVGKTPMYDGFSLTSLNIGASARINTLVPPSASDYDFSAYRVQRGIDYAKSFLQRQSAIMRNNQPRVTFEAHDPVPAGTDYSIGQWAVLDIPSDADPLIFDEDGTRRPNGDLDTSDLAVLITGREPARDFGAYKLTGRAINYGQALGRFRAPSAEVDAWNGTTNTITVAAASAFSSDRSDEKGFTAGQQVQLYDASGALRSATVQTIQSVSTPQEIELDGNFGVTPAAGDILELATYDNYTHEDFGTLRGYCYLAGSSDTLGSAGDDADEWQ